MVVIINNVDEYNKLYEMLSYNQIMLIDFSASWCGPCKKMLPNVHNLSNKYPEHVICSVDVDEVEELANEYNIKSLPTFVFIMNRKICDVLEGADVTLLNRKMESLVLRSSDNISKNYDDF